LGGLRRLVRELRTLRGAVAFVLGVSIIGFAVSAVLRGKLFTAAMSPDALGDLYRSGLLTFVLVGQIKTLGDKAVNFTPGEVDFLFAGPFDRRELLVYRVLSALGGVLVLSAILTILFVGLGAWWPAVFIGAVLTFLFLNQVAMCLAILRESLEAQAFSWVRRAFAFLVVGLIVVSIAYGLSLQSRQGALDVLGAAYGTWTMQTLLLPFIPFAEVVTARSFDPMTLSWVAVCVLVNLGTFLLLVRLDAGSLELSEALSRRDLLQSRRPDGGAGGRWGIRRGRARPVPIGSLMSLLPRMKGVGILASLQLTHAIRGYRLLAELAFVVLVIAWAVSLSQGGADAGESPDLNRLLYAAIWTTIIISNPLRFDFRGGLHNLEYLKTLPLPAWAICAGQLFTPVLITLLYQTPFLVMAAEALTPAQVVAVIALAIPLNILWYGLENLGFLLAPASQSSRGLGDIQYIGRQLLMLSVKIALLSMAALLAFGMGLLASYVLLDFAFLVYVIVFVLVAEALMLIGLLALAFKRFDPSRTQPHDA
jgi:hypothetical protein